MKLPGIYEGSMKNWAKKSKMAMQFRALARVYVNYYGSNVIYSLFFTRNADDKTCCWRVDGITMYKLVSRIADEMGYRLVEK